MLAAEKLASPASGVLLNDDDDDEDSMEQYRAELKELAKRAPARMLPAPEIIELSSSSDDEAQSLPHPPPRRVTAPVPTVLSPP